MHHRNRFAIRSGDCIYFLIKSRKLFFKHNHGKYRGTCTDISCFNSNGICCHHSGACITLGRCHGNTGFKIAGHIEKCRSAFGKKACVFARRKNFRQNVLRINAERRNFTQSIKFIKHFFIIVFCCAVYREHTRCLADTENKPACKQIMNISCQCGQMSNIFCMFLAVKDCLVKMSNTPTLRNIKIEKFCKFFRRLGGNCVSPCAKFSKQIHIFIKRKIAVHHCRHAER